MSPLALGMTSIGAAPSAGVWELSMTREGTPSGPATRTGSACLAADALARAPEQTIIEAAARQGGGNEPNVACEYRDVRREAGQSSWQSVCEGPMGRMQGTGSGTLGPDAVRLQQSFTVKAVFGSLNIRQTVSGRRIGDCR